ncbi:MAG: S-layer homology domain-containing protein, partial [Syntrophomonas sp.]|nr:S-layer homology domain-containing protein [Syntrophomonas sp.]
MNPWCISKKATWYGLKLILISCISLLIVAYPAQAADTAPTPAAFKSQFSDVPSTDANAIYINFLAERGIIIGYPDGGYHPDEALTRAQAATVIVKAAGLSVESALISPFNDIDNNHWAKAYIATAAKAGYISGMPDGSYHPEEKLTRAQAISLILRLSKQDISGIKLPAGLTDIDEKHWAAPSVALGLASGMVGLSTDGKQYLPDVPFSRINLAHALGVLLTTDPELYATNLEGTLKVREGIVKVRASGSQEIQVKTEITVKSGDTINIGAKSSAELNYPDGSSILIKENTQLSVVESQGRKYIKTDGSEGTAIEWLDLKLKQGTILGGLATRHETTEDEQPEKDKTTGQIYQPGSKLIASLDDWKLLAAEGNQLPWYTASQQKKVKIQVDMPWGVAAIRGTFFEVSVATNGAASVSCLTGNAEVSNHGITVPLVGGQETVLTASTVPPTPTTPMSKESVKEFLAEKVWIETTAQVMDQVQEAAPPPPPPAAAIEQQTVPTINPEQIQQPAAPIQPTVPDLPTTAVPQVSQMLTTLEIVTQAMEQQSNTVPTTPVIENQNNNINNTTHSTNQTITVPVVAGQPLILSSGVSFNLGQMNIPAGATVSVHEVSNPDIETSGMQAAGKIVDINFNNMTINQAVQLTLPLNQGVDPEKAAIYLYNNGTWEYQPSHYENGAIVATVTHFSIYGVLADTSPPANPSISQGNINSTSAELILSAQDSSGEIHYQIYRNGELLTKTSNNSYTDNGLAGGTIYHYQVKAIDRFNNISDFSSILDITTTAEQPTLPLPSDNARLSSLSLSEGSLTPTFSPEHLTYNVSVAESVYSVNIFAVTEDPLASITIPNPVWLDTGVNTANVIVTAEDGTTTKTYTLNIEQDEAPQPPSPPSNNVRLNSLYLSEGILSPTFSPEQLTYNVSVTESVYSINIFAVSESPLASVIIPDSVSLNIGENTANIIVTAEDGITTETYTLNINRVAVPSSTISPTTYDFDKNISTQADVAVTMTLNGNTLINITNGAYTLIPNTDYIVSGNIITIKKEYLANQLVGTTILAFIFSAGASQTLSITSVNTAPIASGVYISGTRNVGQMLTGHYTYYDADGDEQGGSTFQWYRASLTDDSYKTVISGVYTANYTLTAYDIEKNIYFEVTPVAATGLLIGTPVLSRAVHPISNTSGTINADTIWTLANSPYYVTGNVTVAAGKTLTIEPGVVVKFADNVGLYVSGNLIAQGTEGSPIYFTDVRDDSAGADDTNGDGATSSPAAGWWRGIQVVNGGNATIDYCTVNYGGYTVNGYIFDNRGGYRIGDRYYFYNLCKIGTGMLSVTNSTISNGGDYGILIANSSEVHTVSNNTISSNAYYGLYIYNSPAAHTITGNTINNNGDIGIYINASAGVNTITTNNINHNGGYGMWLSNSAGAHVITGNTISNNGGGIALSSSGNPNIENNTIDSNTQYGIHSINSDSIILNNTITNNSKYGLHIEGALVPSSVTGNTITGNTLGPIEMAGGDANGLVLVNNTDTDHKYIAVNGSTVNYDTTWPNQGYPYYVTGNVTVAASKTLTIEPGVVVKFADNVGLYVSGNLIAQGTEGSPIYFTDVR